MTLPLSLTDSMVSDGIRAWLLSVVSCEVVRGKSNRVAAPLGPCIVFTPIGLQQLSTDVASYDGVASESVSAATMRSVQVDCYGPQSSDWATIIGLMFRSSQSGFFLANYDIAPLWMDEPISVPYTNDSKQYEERWTFKIHLQYNPVVTITQDFAVSAKVQAIDAEHI